METTALELIFKVAESLPRECKRIFDLLYKEQLSYQDIADQLQLRIQTVRNRTPAPLPTFAKSFNNILDTSFIKFFLKKVSAVVVESNSWIVFFVKIAFVKGFLCKQTLLIRILP